MWLQSIPFQALHPHPLRSVPVHSCMMCGISIPRQTPCCPLSMLQFARTLHLNSGIPELCSFLWKLAAWSRAWKKGGALLSSWCFKVFIVFWINSFFFHFWLSFSQWKSRGTVVALETTSRLTLPIDQYGTGIIAGAGTMQLVSPSLSHLNHRDVIKSDVKMSCQRTFHPSLLSRSGTPLRRGRDAFVDNDNLVGVLITLKSFVCNLL